MIILYNFSFSGTLFIPGGIPCVIEILQELCIPLPFLFAGKILLALPGTYHLFNGIRHLVRNYNNAMIVFVIKINF